MCHIYTKNTIFIVFEYFFNLNCTVKGADINPRFGKALICDAAMVYGLKVRS